MPHQRCYKYVQTIVFLETAFFRSRADVAKLFAIRSIILALFSRVDRNLPILNPRTYFSSMLRPVRCRTFECVMLPASFLTKCDTLATAHSSTSCLAVGAFWSETQSPRMCVADPGRLKKPPHRVDPCFCSGSKTYCMRSKNVRLWADRDLRAASMTIILALVASSACSAKVFARLIWPLALAMAFRCSLFPTIGSERIRSSLDRGGSSNDNAPMGGLDG